MRGPYIKPATTTYRKLFNGQTSYRQDIGAKRRIPLPYSKAEFELLSVVASPLWRKYQSIDAPGAATTASYTAYSTRERDIFPSDQSLYNQCYERFKGKYRHEVMTAVNAFEWRSALESIQGACRLMSRPLQTTLKGAQKALGRAQRKSWKRPTKQGKRTKWRRTARDLAPIAANELLKDAGDAWLSFHFGVAPLMQDLYNALVLFTHQNVDLIVYAKVKVNVDDSRNIPQSSYVTACSIRGQAAKKVKIGAIVRVTNPNLFLLDQLGLLNPAAVAWELIPFSFLVDWFVNIGDVINSLTDTVGVSISDAYTTYYRHGSGEALYYYTPGVVPPVGRVVTKMKYSWVNMRRVQGIAKPKLQVELPNLGLSRAATAVALITQQLQRFIK